MAIVIYPTVQPLQLSKNFPDLEISVDDLVVNVLLQKNGITVLEEEYVNGPLMSIIVKLKSLLHSLLTVPEPGNAEIEEVTGSLDDFSLQIGIEDPVTFKVLKGGVGKKDFALEADYAIAFCNSRFLSWQPPKRQVTSFDNYYLTYYCTVDTSLKYQVFPDVAEYTLPMLEGKCYRINIGELAYTELNVNRILLWAERAGGAKSAEQEFIKVAARSESIDVFLFENSLGGIDTVEFTGSLTEVDEHDISRAIINEEMQEYGIDYNRIYSKETGYFATEAERLWMRDFYTSLQKWHYSGGVLRKIYVTSWKNESERLELNSASFVFSYAKDDGTMLIS
jgi:hypothetical protein